MHHSTAEFDRLGAEPFRLDIIFQSDSRKETISTLLSVFFDWAFNNIQLLSESR